MQTVLIVLTMAVLFLDRPHILHLSVLHLGLPTEPPGGFPTLSEELHKRTLGNKFGATQESLSHGPYDLANPRLSEAYAKEML